MKMILRDLEIECDDLNDLSSCFMEIIWNAHKKYGKKVVILVDEYDKPLLDVITDKPTAIQNRKTLKNRLLRWLLILHCYYLFYNSAEYFIYLELYKWEKQNESNNGNVRFLKQTYAADLRL